LALGAWVTVVGTCTVVGTVTVEGGVSELVSLCSELSVGGVLSDVDESGAVVGVELSGASEPLLQPANISTSAHVVAANASTARFFAGGVMPAING
jgi:hypothetical protein